MMRSTRSNRQTPAVGDNPPKLSDSWRTRAEECRATANIFRNAAARDRMLKVAEDFERMALKVQDRELIVGTGIK